ncbi:MAG: hypothetical protein ACOCU8_00110 [Patescibacteria group bacterium]
MELISQLLPVFMWSFFYAFPVFAGFILYYLWIRYIRGVYIKDVKWSLLEIRMPKEITKTPLAMEVILSGLHNTADNTFIKRIFEGYVRPWFTLEIVASGGRIKFYIRVMEEHRNLAESLIYSQYPSVEIKEVEDYVNNVPFGEPEAEWEMFGVEFKLEKEDAYPIKTYVDYGMDKHQEEEEKTDPMTANLEFLGSVSSEEQIWIQIPARASIKRFQSKDSFFKKVDWKEDGQKLIEKLSKRDQAKGGDQASIALSAFTLTPGERKVLEAVERNVSKLGFDCGLRAIYLAPKGVFKKTNIGGLIATVKQYNSADLNGFKPDLTTSFNYPWQDIGDRRLARRKWRLFDSYKRRSFFYPPYEKKQFVLNTEELATIFHLPGQVASTPGLDRIESNRAEPPANLPL